MPHEIRAMLPQAAIPGEQLLVDLEYLNGIGHFLDDTDLVAVWLRTAIVLTLNRTENQVFVRMLEARDGPEQPTMPVAPATRIRPWMVTGGIAVVAAGILGLAIGTKDKAGDKKPGPEEPVSTATASASAVVPASTSAVAPIPETAPVAMAANGCPVGMAKIPGGKFKMGSNDGFYEDEKPIHPVSVDGSAWIGRRSPSMLI